MPPWRTLTSNNKFSGCKQDKVRQCEPGGSNAEELFEIHVVSNTFWPSSLNYERFPLSSENDYSRSCLSDCNRVVAAIKDGTCWKKKLPLSKGRLERSTYGKALVKVPKSDDSSKFPLFPSSDEGKKNQPTPILAVSILLGLLQDLITLPSLCTDTSKPSMMPHNPSPKDAEAAGGGNYPSGSPGKNLHIRQNQESHRNRGSGLGRRRRRCRSSNKGAWFIRTPEASPSLLLIPGELTGPRRSSAEWGRTGSGWNQGESITVHNRRRGGAAEGDFLGVGFLREGVEEPGESFFMERPVQLSGRVAAAAVSPGNATDYCTLRIGESGVRHLSKY
ncbi:hypothetical protein RHGRI_019473 [Rhododendron griersonianum]|uniref:Uncharacterized protein n=1 Tax=Rhododendron griersonianum TaxID=479676 RepID=A0AAV6JCR5_9ERIC|nr:hypothetical protein RHGRI_019473 [Rhododendron griersonianum]